MRLSDRRIAAWRLANQRLIGRPLDGPVDVVGHLLGVQAENYSPATWALGARCTPTTSTEVDQLYSSGQVLRTHVLRTTWHFVRPDDIAWLCALTGPRLRRIHSSLQRQLGIDDDTIGRAVLTVVDSLEATGPLTRDALRERLDATGAPTAGHALTLITSVAEADGLICSGPLVDGEHTHDLLERRAPHARRLDREEALAELTWRYVRGHGPVTEGDLCYWASLTRTDARSGLAAQGDRVSSFEHDGRRHWFASGTEPDEEVAAEASSSAHLLQILDEMYRGYQESRLVLDEARSIARGREPSTGMVLVGGQIAGSTTRSLRHDTIAFEITPYRDVEPSARDRIDVAADRCGRFFGRRAVVRVAERRTDRHASGGPTVDPTRI